MPELPEVEVVRRGIAEHVSGRVVASVQVHHPRAVRKHVPGAEDFSARLAGRRINAAHRRGKYLWLELAENGGPTEAVLTHLGMSGQMLVKSPDAELEKHLRVLLRFADGGPDLRFVDQRTFGGMTLTEVVPVGGLDVPEPIAHIAVDPLEPAFDLESVVTAMRSRRTGVKRALLDQTLLSGVGNIYADESLWRAKLHFARPTATLTRPEARRLLHAVTEVLGEALQQGGTSFDALYVNVNGESGYFDRSLAVYGQQDLPCPRCGAPVRRDSFMNRSSYTCPVCQPRPRNGHW